MNGLFTAAAILLLAFLGTAAAAQVSVASVFYANQTLQQARSVVAQVNESGYLLFYPNLTSAYADLSKAQQFYNTSPQSSVYYSQQAISKAQAEYSSISSYKYYSALVMGALTLIFVFLLLKLFVPVRKPHAKKARR